MRVEAAAVASVVVSLQMAGRVRVSGCAAAWLRSERRVDDELGVCVHDELLEP